MLKVFLCDDVPLQLCMLEDLVRQYFIEKELPVDIRKFEYGEKLLETVEKEGSADIYFLDMILPGIQGIGIGRKLREMGDKGKIIYVTSTSEYAVDSYSVDAFFYLLKPIGRKVIFEVLDKAFSELVTASLQKDSPAPEQLLEIKTRSGKLMVNSAGLLYVDIFDRGLRWHMDDGTDHLGPMLRIPFAQAVENILENPDFIFSGSYLVVNRTGITAIGKESISFRDGSTVYPSKAACATLYDKIKSNIF